MIVVVADTSPLHYLIQVQAIGVLPHFFDQVVIPKSVQRELLDPSTPPEVRDWMLHPPSWATNAQKLPAQAKPIRRIEL